MDVIDFVAGERPSPATMSRDDVDIRGAIARNPIRPEHDRKVKYGAFGVRRRRGTGDEQQRRRDDHLGLAHAGRLTALARPVKTCATSRGAQLSP
jgi:hypothetical protein